MSSTNARCKPNGEPKGSHLLRKLLYLFMSVGAAKLEIAVFFKPWAFQVYLGTDNEANKHKTQRLIVLLP